MILDKYIALVTGASRGIGQGIAMELGRQGATVIGTATSESGAEAIGGYLAANHCQGTGLVLNVNDGDRIEQLVAETRQRYGEISILVNNAGITRDNLLLRMKDEEWDEIMSINLKSVFRLSRAVLRDMVKARYGRIINITSVSGVTGNAGQTNYSAAKAGVAGFSKALAREVASRNITVNCVAPGFIDTDMTRSLSEAQLQALTLHVPLGRLGRVEEVAAAVVFLASPGAAYITGCSLHVNGGMYMD
ncbi:MAG TPA: 3-oxoacyl-ACP reductase FabG [Burkholderiales bacterium]|nr:3-oxoacyl-ACP reductase FabG [Burkholderiales bacterium]